MTSVFDEDGIPVAKSSFQPLPRIGENIIHEGTEYVVVKVKHETCPQKGYYNPPSLIVRKV